MTASNILEYYDNMISNGYYDLYYWDYMKEIGFHIHRSKNNVLVVMKKTKRQIRKTNFDTFLHYCNSYNTLKCVTPDEYFYFRPF